MNAFQVLRDAYECKDSNHSRNPESVTNFRYNLKTNSRQFHLAMVSPDLELNYGSPYFRSRGFCGSTTAVRRPEETPDYINESIPEIWRIHNVLFFSIL